MRTEYRRPKQIVTIGAAAYSIYNLPGRTLTLFLVPLGVCHKLIRLNTSLINSDNADSANNY